MPTPRVRKLRIEARTRRVLRIQNEWGVGDLADVAASSVPVLGGVYDAVRGAYSAGKALKHGISGVKKWVSGDKAGAKKSFGKAAVRGVDAAGRVAGAVAGELAPVVGGAAGAAVRKVGTKAVSHAVGAVARKEAGVALTKTVGSLATKGVSRVAGAAERGAASAVRTGARKVTDYAQRRRDAQVASNEPMVASKAGPPVDLTLQEFKKLSGIY